VEFFDTRKLDYKYITFKFQHYILANTEIKVYIKHPSYSKTCNYFYVGNNPS